VILKLFENAGIGRSIMSAHFEKLRNSRGLSLTEMLVGIIVGAIVIAAGYKAFVTQQDALEGSGDEALIRSKGRLTVKLLSKELRLVGFGIPADAQIVSIGSNTITYRAATDLQTIIPPGESGSIAAASADTSLNVVSAEGFADLNNIIIFDPSSEDFEFNSIDGDPDTASDPNTLPLDDPLTNTYTFGVNSKSFRVNQYNNIIFALSGTSIEKTVDGNTEIFVDDVDSSEGLVFEYFDVSGNSTSTISEIHKIAVTLNFIDPDNDRATIQFKTDVSLRNISA
jgi:prepilin-type N-terminal cleavage/methylation domain-containing protein